MKLLFPVCSAPSALPRCQCIRFSFEVRRINISIIIIIIISILSSMVTDNDDDDDDDGWPPSSSSCRPWP